MITVQNVRELFATGEPEATLVVADGRPEVVAGDAAERDGFVVARLGDLVEEHGPRPSDADCERIAAALDSAVSHLGG